MTTNQKLKSIEKKMKRIQENNYNIDLEYVVKRFSDIERYYKLKQEHFVLKFNLEHCEKCGKKL